MNYRNRLLLRREFIIFRRTLSGSNHFCQISRSVTVCSLCDLEAANVHGMYWLVLNSFVREHYDLGRFCEQPISANKTIIPWIHRMKSGALRPRMPIWSCYKNLYGLSFFRYCCKHNKIILNYTYLDRQFNACQLYQETTQIGRY